MNGLYTIQSKEIQINFNLLSYETKIYIIANCWYITSKCISSVTLLGITINSKLKFKEHINNIMKKGYHKLYALRRLRKFLT